MLLCQVRFVGVLPLQLLVADAAVDGVVGGMQLPHVLRVRDVILEGGGTDLTIAR